MSASNWICQLKEESGLFGVVCCQSPHVWQRIHVWLTLEGAFWVCECLDAQLSHFPMSKSLVGQTTRQDHGPRGLGLDSPPLVWLKFLISAGPADLHSFYRSWLPKIIGWWGTIAAFTRLIQREAAVWMISSVRSDGFICRCKSFQYFHCLAILERTWVTSPVWPLRVMVVPSFYPASFAAFAYLLSGRTLFYIKKNIPFVN